MASSDRRVRVTLRCLVDDLALEIPPADVEIGRVDDPIIEKAWDFAGSHPDNQKRIEAITDRLIYRFTHGRQRIATWLDQDTDVVWVCAVAIRAEGDARDFYSHVERLYQAETLFPDSSDALRQRVEARFVEIRAIREEAPACLADAESHPGEERDLLIAGRIRVILYLDASEDLEEIWLSVHGMDTNGEFLTDQMKQTVFAAFALAAREAEWDDAWNWPNRDLEWYEVAKLGVRARQN